MPRSSAGWTPTDAQTRSSSKKCCTRPAAGSQRTCRTWRVLRPAVVSSTSRSCSSSGRPRRSTRRRPARRTSSTAGRRRAPCRSARRVLSAFGASQSLPYHARMPSRAWPSLTRNGSTLSGRNAACVCSRRARAAPSRRTRSSAPAASGSSTEIALQLRHLTCALRAGAASRARSSPVAAQRGERDRVPTIDAGRVGLRRPTRCRRTGRPASACAGFQTASPPQAGQANFDSATVLGHRQGSRRRAQPMA